MFAEQRRMRKRESGSALMLVPTTFLILVMLTLFTLNTALRFLAQQELERLASSAANNAVSALSRSELYTSGDYAIAATGVRDLGELAAAPRTDSVRDVTVSIRVIDENSVRVEATGTPQSVFSPLLPAATASPITVTVSADVDTS